MTTAARLCAECGAPCPPSLGCKPRRFCGPTCAATYRQRTYRARHALPQVGSSATYVCTVCRRAYVAPRRSGAKRRACGDHCRSILRRRAHLAERRERFEARLAAAHAALAHDVELLRACVRQALVSVW
jgi:hypothetical protein